MKRKIQLCLLAMLITSMASAQKIKMEFPKHPKGLCYIYITAGLESDTVFQGNLDQKGKLDFQFPERLSGYQGLGYITLNRDVGITFILNGKGDDISLSSEEMFPSDSIDFHDSQENVDNLYWLSKTTEYSKKLEVLKPVLAIYDDAENSPLIKYVEEEYNSVKEKDELLSKEITDSKHFGGEYWRNKHYLYDTLYHLPYFPLEEQDIIKQNFINSFDIEKIVGTDLWHPWLNALLWCYYEDDVAKQDMFTRDMKTLLERQQSDFSYNILASTVLDICSKSKWKDAENDIIYHLVNKGRIINPTQQKLKTILTFFSFKTGDKMPDLKEGMPDGKKIILFYESACPKCVESIIAMSNATEQIAEKGYTIITVCADKNRAIYEGNSGLIPWQHKYCDFEGFNGANFKKFKVYGTPTIFVLDENNTLTGQYGHFNQMDFLTE